MSWHRSTFGKYHRPSHIGRTSVQFAVDEVSYAAEAKSYRSYSASQTRNLPKIPALSVCDPDRGENHPDETAMKRHSALPDCKDRQGVAYVTGEIVEQDIAQPTTDHHPNNQIEQQIVEIICCQVQLAILGVTTEDEKANDERQHVHQPIPPQLHWADAQKHRIDVGIRNC